MNAENRTALVVDDDPTARFLMRTVLKQLGCRVAEAKLGVEGLQQVRDMRPDLLILDVLMPHMDGLDTLKYLRADPRFQTMAVVVASVLDEDHEIVTQLKQLGIRRYFMKPLDHSRVVGELEALFEELAGPSGLA